MKILGLHFGSHDTSAALVVDGALVATMEEERFDHVKHTTAFPIEAVSFCLDQGQVAWRDIDVIAYASDAALTNRYKAAFAAAGYPGATVPAPSDQARIEGRIRHELTARWHEDLPPFFFVDHHTAHAASVFFVSPFDESAILTVDGMGNWVTTTLAHGRGHRIDTRERTAHPHSLGLFFGALTQYLGFEAACDEGKTMGLAPYGRPRFADFFRQVCRIDDGRPRLDLAYFDMHKNTLFRADKRPRRWYADALVDRLGPPRAPEAEISDHDADVACSAQLVLEECCFQLLDHLHGMTGSPNVCLTGGVALNCSMNGKVVANTGFRDCFVMPAANDAGLGIGAALAANAARDPGSFRRVPLRHAYYGSAPAAAEIERAIGAAPAEVSITRPADLTGAVADLLSAYRIVGRFDGRMEFGPRALGNRSILANPCRAETKDIVNQKVKFRENFRPFAPMVPLDEAADYFDIDGEAPFMLKVAAVRPDKRAVVPAITHVDGSARVQTVSRDQNPALHALLLAVKARTGVPVLLNTSFNVRGDTIVRTADDAMRCFLGTGLEALAIGPYLLTKKA